MTGARRVTFGIGALAGTSTGPDGTPDLPLDLGPHHPSAHGLMRLHLELDGARIVTAEPEIGFLHRGAEKLFEVRDYRQAVVLANRHDWLSAFNNEIGIVLAVERMLGMVVPERATWTRTLLAELGRVLNHLSFLGAYPWEHGGTSPAYYAYREREAVQRVLEEASGGRMHVMANRVGGLREDVPDGWLDHVRAAVRTVRHGLDPLTRLVHDDPTFRARTRGVGVLTREAVEQHGVSGPLARAAGLDLDLRRDDPYLAYADLHDAGVLRVVTRNDGDALARFEVLHDQVLVSLDLVEACAERLEEIGPGPVNLKLPKVLRAPEGHTYSWTENPLGVNGYLLVSRGEKTPWRLKLRTASFNNVSALGEVLVGADIADLVAVVSSFFFVIGDVDK
jgi:NADH-quinone oxidoreductase subunit D